MRNRVYRAVGSALFLLNRACALSPALWDFCAGADDPDGPRIVFMSRFAKHFVAPAEVAPKRRPEQEIANECKGKCSQVGN